MVALAGGYYVKPFREERDFTQGDQLSPTIFNVVVDAVVRHGEFLVAEQEGGGGAAMMTETWHRRQRGKSRNKTTDNGSHRGRMQF